MRNLIILALSVCTLAFIPNAGKVKIEGSFQLHDKVEKIYLSYREGGQTVRDSVQPTGTQFMFEKPISEPTLAYITFRFSAAENEKPRFERMEFFAEPGVIKIDIKDSLRFAKVKGSKSNEAYVVLQEKQKPFDEKSDALGEKYYEYRKAGDKEGMQRIEDEMDKINEEVNEKVYAPLINENPKSPIALYVLQKYAGYSIDPAKVEPLYKRLPATVQQSTAGKAFNEQIQTAKKTAIGAVAMDFTQNDTADVPVSLSSFRGKYVLLDFWASWCGPCRAENPNVVKAFNEFKDRNFTVLSVSLDQPGKKDAWLGAIHKDGLTWTNVSDLQFWNNAVAKQYGIQAIPQNLLIDPSGKIIAKNVRGEELGKKLTEVLK